MTFPGADDPAYEHELAALEEECRSFLAARESGEFVAQLFVCGRLTVQCAIVYKLSPPARFVDVADLFRREPEEEPA